MLRLKGDLFWGYLLVAPAMIGIFILNLYPALGTMYLSFFKTKGLRRDILTFVGWDNYRFLLGDPTFWQSLKNTLTYTVVTVPLSIFFSLILASLLNTNIKGRGLFRTIYFSPVVVPGVALAMIWLYMLQSNYGLINQLLGTNIPFTTNRYYALPAVAMVGIWSSIGSHIILFLGGLQGISKIYYEASRIDGASPVRQFFSITLPLLSPTIFLVVILAIIGGLQVFGLPLLMVGIGNPAYAYTRPVLEFYYRYTFNAGKSGIGSVVILILLVIILLITVLQFRLQRKWVHYDHQ